MQQGVQNRRRQGVIVERANLPGCHRLIPWLALRYGMSQVSRVGVPANLWHAAGECQRLAEALRERLARRLHRKGVLIVLGRAGECDQPGAVAEEQQRVRRIVSRLRDGRVPVETVGLWVVETFDPECPVASMELSRFDPPSGGGVRTRPPGMSRGL